MNAPSNQNSDLLRAYFQLCSKIFAAQSEEDILAIRKKLDHLKKEINGKH